MSIVSIGLDLAKTAFQVHGVDASGQGPHEAVGEPCVLGRFGRFDQQVPRMAPFERGRPSRVG